MSEFTKTDDDNLADIIWWIKGYMASKSIDSEVCDFGAHHIESLKRARNTLQEKWEGK